MSKNCAGVIDRGPLFYANGRAQALSVKEGTDEQG